jgi:transmembrane sensor
MEKYSLYAVSDFVSDDLFINWVKYGVDVDGRWQEWLDTRPLNLAEYNEARGYILTVLSAETIVDDAHYQQLVWENIEQGIAGNERRMGKIRSLRVWSSVAATTIGLLITGWWFYNSKVEIVTGYGEHRTVTLPDHSEINLNANSQISYYRAWSWHAMREVWLTGEALFNVTHLNRQPDAVKRGDQFVAHAGDLNVQVLGTKFNIKYRRHNVLVALMRGKISVSKAGSGAVPYVVEPGLAVEYKDGQLTKRLISGLHDKPLAWTEHKMMASGITVAAIIENFEDTYGNRIVIDNPALLNKQIDGTISVRTRESTLYMLANLLNATVQESDGVYYLKSK